MNRIQDLDDREALDADLNRWMATEAPPQARAGLLGEILAQTPSVPQHSRESLWRRAFRQTANGSRLPVMGAVVVIVVLVAAAGWLSRAKPEGPAQPAQNWVRVTDPAFANATVMSVIRSGAQLIAVGAISESGRSVGAVWTSPDGVSWTKISDDAVFMDSVAATIAVSGDTLVIRGADTRPPTVSGPGVSTPRVWLAQGQWICDTCSAAPPGVRWQVSSTVFPPSGTTATVYAAIAAGGPGFVLVGTELSHPADGDIPIGAAVATSADGSTWTFIDPTGAAFVGGSMTDIAAGPSGLVAVGETALAPTVWTSNDGLAWTRLPQPIGPSSASPRSVAASPSGFVAVGDDGGSGVVWLSTDGRTWRTAPSSPDLANSRMEKVSWLGSEFVATGETSAGDGVAWSSADGLAWTRLETGAIFTGAPIRAAGTIGPRTVLFGVDAAQSAVIAVGSAGPPGNIPVVAP